ncbi:MAG: hypothetical protein Q4C85_07195 [Actinomyces sp.]|uniref:hypothetical protein n=1 Tax=Actinomyces sp. TaxID=29317 RepID=UPI0026DD1157|nr:hypothetical protein [Actinomyces sp.]MDO4243528.1 hypothetical protein [Actinomyces sp.]
MSDYYGAAPSHGPAEPQDIVNAPDEASGAPGLNETTDADAQARTPSVPARRTGQRHAGPSRSQVRAVLATRDALAASSDEVLEALASALGVPKDINDLTAALAAAPRPKMQANAVAALRDLLAVADADEPPMAALALAVGKNGVARAAHAWNLAAAVGALHGRPGGNPVDAARELAEAATSRRGLLEALQVLVDG